MGCSASRDSTAERTSPRPARPRWFRLPPREPGPPPQGSQLPGPQSHFRPPPHGPPRAPGPGPGRGPPPGGAPGPGGPNGPPEPPKPLSISAFRSIPGMSHGPEAPQSDEVMSPPEDRSRYVDDISRYSGLQG